MLRRPAAVLLAALMAVLLAVPAAASAQGGERALVRVAHFAPGLLKGDVYVVYVNGRLQLKGVPFKTVSDYLEVEPGRFTVEVREAGAAVGSPPVVAATVRLRAGRAYTVAVFGQLTSVQAALLTDDLTPPGEGKSKVRLIQAIPGEQSVDLMVGGDVLVGGARFPSASGYQEVPAGSLDAEVRKAGGGEVLARADNLRLPGGSIATLVAVGGIGEQRQLLDIRDAASSAAPAGGVATGAGGTSSSPSPGGRRFALLLLIGGGLAATAGFVVQQRRSGG